LLTSLLTACDLEVPALTDETVFYYNHESPLEIDTEEKRQLVRILNAHRDGWQQMYSTPVAGRGGYFFFNFPKGESAQIRYLYSGTVHNSCVLYLSVNGFEERGVFSQRFDETSCNLFDVISKKR